MENFIKMALKEVLETGHGFVQVFESEKTEIYLELQKKTPTKINTMFKIILSFIVNGEEEIKIIEVPFITLNIITPLISGVTFVENEDILWGLVKSNLVEMGYAIGN